MGLIGKVSGTAGLVAAGTVGLGTAYYGEADNPNDALAIGVPAAAATFAGGVMLYRGKKKVLDAGISAGEWVGDKSLKLGERIGSKVIDDATNVGERAKIFAKDTWEGRYDQNVKNAASRLADKGGRVADNYLKIKTGDGKLLPNISLKKKTWGYIGALALFSTGSAMANESEAMDAGYIDPYMVGPAPRLPSYDDNAGATGDLVFALHKNARPF